MEAPSRDNSRLVLARAAAKRLAFRAGFRHVSGNRITTKFSPRCYTAWPCRRSPAPILCSLLLPFSPVCVCVSASLAVCNPLVHRFVYNAPKGSCEDLEDSVSGFSVFSSGVVAPRFCTLHVHSFW